MKKRANNPMLYGTFAFLAMILVCFCFIITAAMPEYHSVSDPEKMAEADLSTDCIALSSYNMESYIGKLYTSGDFASGTPQQGDASARYRTYRIVLHLEPGVTYGLTGQTATYAQRVYINGELMNETGTVSDQADDFVPKTDFFTVYFTPETEETEIIVQHSWFCHRSGVIHALYLSQQQVITRLNRVQTLRDGLLTGMLLAMGIFFLGMYLIHRAGHPMHWFALSCLCAAFHYMIYENKQIMTLLPNLNWYAAHRAEALLNIWYFCFIAMFCYAILNYMPGKRTSLPIFLLVGILSCFYLFAPSTVYSYYTVPSGVLMAVCQFYSTAVLLIHELRQHRLRKLTDIIVCSSMVLTVAEYLVEAITYSGHVLYLRVYLVLLISFCNAIVLMIDHINTKETLNYVQLKEQQVEEENAMLAHMNELKTGFMRNIAHEIKTPLTVMSGYAQLTGKQIQRNMVNEETAENLATIVREADRLSQMVSGLLETTGTGAGENAAEPFVPADLLEDAAAVCRPILMKRNNRLTVACSTDCRGVARRESLLQVLINLSVNAGKHTANGTVSFLAEKDPGSGMIVFTVSDTGEGIRREILPHIFERGYSTDGGNGLGLPLCREILESMGGGIWIRDTGTNGTTFCFTVPAEKEENA